MSDYASLLAILTKLVAFRSDSANQKQMRECIDYVEKLLAGLSLHIHRYESNGLPSLMISTQNSRHPKLLLAAHMDVVPGYPKQFKLEQKAGKLYGRGTFDMKFAAACYLELLRHLKSDPHKYDVALMLTFDEEEGGRNGVEYLLNQGYTADMCLLPDGSDDWNIEASAKGFAIASITTKGRSGHGSRPWEADNAALQIVDIIKKVQKAFPYRKHMATTVTPTILRAGSAFNQIPGEASVNYDIRFPDAGSLDKAAQKLERLCAKVDAKLVINIQSKAVNHDIGAPCFEAWQATVKETIGREPGFSRSFGASDARYLVPAGIPTIITRPLGGGAHSGEEWISEKGFYDFYEVLRKFVEATARTGSEIDI